MVANNNSSSKKRIALFSRSNPKNFKYTTFEVDARRRRRNAGLTVPRQRTAAQRAAAEAAYKEARARKRAEREAAREAAAMEEEAREAEDEDIWGPSSMFEPRGEQSQRLETPQRSKVNFSRTPGRGRPASAANPPNAGPGFRKSPGAGRPRRNLQF